MLIFAVAVATLHNVRGGVRLIPPDAERDAHVAHIPRHKIVQPPRFFRGRLRSLGEFLGFFSDAVINRHALALQLCIPLRDLLPVGESCQLHIGTGVLLRFIFLLVAFRLDVLHHPGVNPAVSRLVNVRLARRRLELHFARLRDVDLQPIFVDHYTLWKCVFVPEVSSGQGGENPDHGAVFERVSGLQRGHGNMPLPVVAVHRRFFQYIGGEILRG